MTRINLPKGVWIPIGVGVDNLSFNLVNEYPDKTNLKAFKIHTGDIIPSQFTQEYVLVKMKQDEFTHAVAFSNSVATNVYVLSVYDDSAVII